MGSRLIEAHTVFEGVDPYWSEATKREARESVSSPTTRAG